MPGSVIDRARCLFGGFKLSPFVAPPLTERLFRPFEWYGLERARLRTEMNVERRRPDATLYTWNEYRIWWPVAANPARLVAVLAETFIAGNPHYFTPSNIPPWPKGSVVLDVGSCEGLFALRATRELAASRVIAIEPGIQMARLLAETVDANGLSDRIEVVQCLAGRESGNARFSECVEDPTQAHITTDPIGEGRDVDIKTLDEITIERDVSQVDVIKIDAEGADVEILQGTVITLCKWRPMLLVTTYHAPDHAREMRMWIESLRLGYSFHFRGLTTMGGGPVRPVLMLAYCSDR
jgi:FkbM family methyltransferase